VENLQVENVPQALHRKIRAHAKRSPVELGRPAARTLEEAREERARDLGAWSSSSTHRRRSSTCCNHSGSTSARCAT